mgnify:CR=1 FL=1
MKIPFSYTWRNLLARKLTTALTAGGMALVVFVFATVLMLEEGLRKTLVDERAGARRRAARNRTAASSENCRAPDVSARIFGDHCGAQCR